MTRPIPGRRIPIALVGAFAILFSACGNSTPAATQAPGATPTIVVVPASAMTHPIKDREDCRKCHVEGIARSKKMPSDHNPYANGACSLCHKQIGEK